MPMPEVKCLPSLIAAIDAADPPPSTRQEKQAWVDEWRATERRLHTKVSAADIAANMITVAEIDSILRTKHIREKVQLHPRKGRRACASKEETDADVGWMRMKVKHGGGPRHPSDTVSVLQMGHIAFHRGTVDEMNLQRFQSVDAFRKGRLIRLDLRTDGDGDYKVAFASPRQANWHIRCRRDLLALAVKPGLYRIAVDRQDPLRLIVDFNERVGDLLLRGCRVRRA